MKLKIKDNFKRDTNERAGEADCVCPVLLFPSIILPASPFGREIRVAGPAVLASTRMPGGRKCSKDLDPVVWMGAGAWP